MQQRLFMRSCARPPHCSKAKWGGGEGGAGHDSTAMSIPGLHVGSGDRGRSAAIGDTKRRSSLEDVPDFNEDPDL